MRKTEEDHVVARERLRGGLLEHPVGKRDQVRLQGAERLAGVGAAGEGADADVRVAEEEPEDLTTGVPARPGDSDGEGRRHVHEHTW
ncbi:hypothetical protein QE405_001536 [Nocardioides zeae]|uniref:Uncharacterized protein n=1 Tax=Nocardioides zeae TaxID=1457234 RepID=A0AAJ1U4W1_9ACTN|nr:hypothetical protein [Nocardioides zeae]